MTVRLLHYADIENAYDDPERIGRLAGTIGALRDETTLVVGAGDNLAPGVLAMVSEGRQALDFFDAVEPDVDTFGNHDFDYGPDAARGVARDSPQTWLAANVTVDGDAFGVDAGVRPWTVVECGGERVGLFGLSAPDTAEITPAATDLSFGDPVDAARECVAALRAEGVDRVVGVSHVGEDDAVAEAVDADAVLGGHLHDLRAERVDGTLLTRTSGHGDELIEVELGAEATARIHDVDDGPLDEAVAASLRARMAEAGFDEVIGRVSEPLERVAMLGESRVGNFVADAFRWAGGTDVGLLNSGAIRDGPPIEGQVTTGDVLGLIPFRQPVVVSEATGAELVDTIREAAGVGRDLPNPDWWLVQGSGLHVEWDARTDELVAATVGGEPVDPDATYTVASLRYLLESDFVFSTLGPEHAVREAGRHDEVIADYAREFGIDPVIEGRLVRHGRPEVDASERAESR